MFSLLLLYYMISFGGFAAETIFGEKEIKENFANTCISTSFKPGTPERVVVNPSENLEAPVTHNTWRTTVTPYVFFKLLAALLS